MSLQQEIARIASRAAFLEELVAHGSREGSRGESSEACILPTKGCERLVGRWLSICSADDIDHFRCRFQRLNCSLTPAALLRGSIKPTHELPDWAEAIKGGLSLIDREPERKEKDNSLPFSMVLMPFVKWAERELKETVGETWQSIERQALRNIRESLLEELSVLSCRSLVLELNVARMEKRLQGDSPEDRFDSFIEGMLKGPWPILGLLSEYPVLGRLMGNAILKWVRFYSELLLRLARDADALAHSFNSGAKLGRITSILPSSDPHNGGKRVLILNFEAGPKLVYKARDIRPEAAFQNLLDWINDRSSLLPLETVIVLTRGTYGYMQFVDYRQCHKPEEVARYYERAGMQMCLLYVLQATDFHHENLIAHGENPVLVDLETLFHPKFRNARRQFDREADAAGARLIADSVIRTGLLPNARLGDRGLPGFDVSGLGGRPGQRYPHLMPVWLDSGTDVMRVDLEYTDVEAKANLPTGAGIVMSEREYAEQVVIGFRAMYRFLSEWRQELTADNSPLKAFVDLPFRFIARPTQTYFDVLWKSLDAEYLRTGLEYSISLEILWRVARDKAIEDLVEQEVRQLHARDIPYFTIRPRETLVVSAGGAKIDGLVETQAWDEVLTRLEGLNEIDQAAQEAMIMATITIARETVTSARTTSTDYEPNAEDQTASGFLEIAIEIAEEIRNAAIRCSDGSISWVGPEYIAANDQYRLQPLSSVLYGGKAGIAVFLASLHLVTQLPWVRDYALATIQDALHQIRLRPSVTVLRQLGVGGYSGLGSVVYALCHCGISLGEPMLLDESERLIGRVEPGHFDQEQSHDIIGGTAGWLLALLALHRARPSEVTLARAEEAAWQLRAFVANAELSSGRQPLGGQRMYGFAHGFAGMGFALWRAWEDTRISEFRAASEYAAGLEVALRAASFPGGEEDFESREWKDVRGSWCYGLTGVGLAIRAGYSALAEHMPGTLETIAQLPLSESDHLCCGNAGRMDLFVEAGASLECISAARRMVARRRERGGWGVTPLGIPGIADYSLLRGSAGIGYSFLRLARPRYLPSVLLLA